MNRIYSLLVLLALLCPASVLAVDPAARWHTIETENFLVHFPEGPHMEALAQKAARISEAAHVRLVAKLGWTPRQKTHVIVTDDVDSANGSAFALYRPWMKLYADVPDEQSVLNDFDDHLWNLIVHEYTHVLHIDTVGGLPDVFNAAFGKLLIPNAYVPRWITEGLATYEESNLSNGGRLRSSLFDMWLRASLLHRPFTLDQVSHVPYAWPGASLAYLYGGHFMSYVAGEVGEDGLQKYFHEYGQRLIPLTLNDTARKTWDGRDFPGLYDAWLQHTRSRIDAQLKPVLEAEVTPFRALTRTGYGADVSVFMHGQDRILFLEEGPGRRPALRSVKPDGTDERLVRELWAGGTFDLSRDDRRVVLSLPEVYEQYHVYEDLWLLDLEKDRLERLTWGLRATDPAWSPDGKQVAFVGRSGAGHTYLGLLDVASMKLRTFIESTPNERVFSPAFTPDGKAVVYTQQEGTGRRLAQVDLATGETTTLLSKGWMILQPSFDPEGRIVFSADRTGIYNLYAFEPGSGALRQLTNLVHGAFQPSVSRDGRHLAFTSYSHEGYDVAVMSASDAFEGELPERSPRPAPAYTDTPDDVREVRQYAAWRTLAPLYWLPLVGQDPMGTTLGITLAGEDILERHLYTAQVSWGLASNEPSAYVSYSNRTFHPGISLYGTTLIAQAPGFRAGLYDRQWAAGAQMVVPDSSLDRYAQISFGYELRAFDPQFEARFAPDMRRPVLPREGRTGTASLGAYWSNARGFTHSVSSEEGHVLGANVRHSGPWTGGTFTFTSVDGTYQTYLRAPWLEHHVFALRLSAGSAVGDLGGRAVFSLGGLQLADPILQLLQGQRAGAGALRGYRPGAFAGNSFALGTLEYRFPLGIVDSGISTLPFFLRRFHAAVFTDVGAVGDRAFELSAPKPGAGVELRTDVLLGYALATQLRLGLAHGFAPEGVTNVYLSVGSSF